MTQSKEASAPPDNNANVLSNQNPPTTSISPLTTPLYPLLPTSATLESSLTTVFLLKPTSTTSPEQLSFILKILPVSSHHPVSLLSELPSMRSLHPDSIIVTSFCVVHHPKSSRNSSTFKTLPLAFSPTTTLLPSFRNLLARSQPTHPL